jgi:metal-sulfur cluster biosynthetic enzyme
VNIYDLGLIYEVRIDGGDQAYIRMTLTSPMCPVAESLPVEIETKVRDIGRLSDVTVEVVWDPPWTPELMSEDARLELNMF